MNSRYDRQIPVIGEDGQKKLFRSTVGIVGCGGLGTNVSIQLASAGIGKMIIADGDHPNITNLNRQFVYREGQEEKKCDLLAEYLRGVSPDTKIETYSEFITEENANIFDGCDVIVDCLDNVSSRKALNRYIVKNDKILVHAGVSGMYGQVSVIKPGVTPCLECFYNDKRDCASPSISFAVSMIASLESAEVVKILTGLGEPLFGKLLTVDLEKDAFEIIEIRKSPSCHVCGSNIQY